MSMGVDHPAVETARCQALSAASSGLWLFIAVFMRMDRSLGRRRPVILSTWLGYSRIAVHYSNTFFASRVPLQCAL